MPTKATRTHAQEFYRQFDKQIDRRERARCRKVRNENTADTFELARRDLFMLTERVKKLIAQSHPVPYPSDVREALCTLHLWLNANLELHDAAEKIGCEEFLAKEQQQKEEEAALAALAQESVTEVLQ